MCVSEQKFSSEFFMMGFLTRSHYEKYRLSIASHLCHHS